MPDYISHDYRDPRIGTYTLLIVFNRQIFWLCQIVILVVIYFNIYGPILL
jgi:hypothetical protein